MHAQLADIDPGTLEAIYLFVFAGLVIALGLVGAGLLARKKDHKAAHFYLVAAAVCGGVTLAALVAALIFGQSSH